MNSFDLLFSEPEKVEYLNKKFDFDIDPDKFMEWLSHEEEDDLTGDYRYDCSSMCEYSCLYISMLLYHKELKGDMRIYSGYFGFWEHYWIGYVIDGVEYFIDLTLKQFISDAPKLAISKRSNTKKGYSFYENIIPTPIKKYVESKKAFDFHYNPVTMEEPPIKINTKIKSFDEMFGDFI